MLFLIINYSTISILTLLRKSLFGAGHRWGRGGVAKKLPLPKISHIYLSMMKLGAVMPYLKSNQKIYESRETVIDFC